jgi:DNA-binding CsgD family transcriptional regulator
VANKKTSNPFTTNKSADEAQETKFHMPVAGASVNGAAILLDRRNQQADRCKPPFGRRKVGIEEELTKNLTQTSIIPLMANTSLEAMLHELQLSYLALVIQNEELQHSYQSIKESRKRLLKQVEKATLELDQSKAESSEANTALKVILKMREKESLDAKNLLILELKQEVMPFLQRLKNSSRDPKHIRLLSTLEANLQRLISSYGYTTSLSSAYKNLTPKEVLVASMVREGASTKAIAATLSLSPETISIHRKNIRKKLGLESKANNLRSYLVTIEK